MIVMCVDPGNNGTGIAIWNEFKKENLPVHVKSYSRKTFDDYMVLLAELIKEYDVEKVYIEQAAYHGTGSVKGQAAAAKGDLIKLAELIGGFRAICYLSESYVELVPVIKWKGQLPKEVVKKRILKVWEGCTATNHDWDAVGIGFYLLGLINR